MYVCDVSSDHVTSVVQTLTDKYPGSKVGGCELDVRDKEQWEQAWTVSKHNARIIFFVHGAALVIEMHGGHRVS